ncbi:MAG: signal peptidase I [Planctomycetes bacterium]|nr:signal peptidase I [Planctomycetota bacterium]
MTQAQKNEKYITSGQKTVDMVYHNLEWIITALAGTLVFIVFVMQVYRIPTGSMAETLRGSHFRLRCQQCGYRYDYDFLGPQVYRMPDNYLPKENVPVLPLSPRCPSCGHYENTGTFVNKQLFQAVPRPVSRGDQIFVLKCIYQFFEPKRWDVIVFKNPIQPQINYIKRLVALPDEKVEIIDGDIYINDKIARKPPHVQEELWMCIYDNDYQPIRPEEKRFNGHTWAQPFEASPAGEWNLKADGTGVFSLDTGADNTVRLLRYNPSQGNDFRATYAYDATMSYPEMPVCSDLMMRYYVKMEGQGAAGARLSKYGIAYEGIVQSDGRMAIYRLENDSGKKLLAEGKCGQMDLSGIQLLRFANTDHLLSLEYGNSRIEYDLGQGKDDAGKDRQSSPTAAIIGYGKLILRHIKLMRDVHYRGADDSQRVLRAYEGKPLKLEADEFFVCGDNSPNSLDARMWDKPALANPGKQYREGIVPRDYLVGKAFFVHFPGSWRFNKENWRKIPYLDGPPEPDGIKIIYGGR